MDIQNKTAIVTGASKGIGLSTANAFIDEGVTVACWSRTPPKEFSHSNFHHFETDLTKEDSVEDSYQKTVDKLGDISILVNNAGVGYRGRMEDTPSRQWRYLFDLNVHGIFYVTKRVITGMKERNEGHIINIGSGAGTNGIPQMSAYCGTKYAVNGITESLHNELRDYGVKVSCISPGSVDTGFSSSNKNKLQPGDLASAIVHMLKCPKNFHYTDIQVRPLQP
ncbi:SDR family oxidoreductase [Rhodohalobacter sulfatireducens]|uniref:SDR family NAD(P)-dependent oxidoreductase n=1 Tax=Rhodohalobacter sulfatireducens TaxID=2911366 RepID=A0ABS9KFS7_9BACT|nr:SDR family NAD(P)-dependent oxidoreductase [Rhodohalobacter sulfatireducens]MCG2589692.1 SDR family NAD(P)-dependent oxidoreductase [Rhodohalobacter sulfatireducens]